MRIVRFVRGNSRPQYAFVQKDQNDGRDYLVALNGYPFSSEQVEPTGERYPLDGEGIRLLAPLLPSKIYGVAHNFRGEAGARPQLYLKPSSAVAGPDDPIVRPVFSQKIICSPMLGIVIGRLCRNVAEKDALQQVLGYSIVDDVCAADVEKLDPSWVRARSFDTSMPMGPWLQTQLDPASASLSASLNGETVPKACGNTSELLCSVAQEISYVSSFSTLLPGDVIISGAPCEGVEVAPGDEIVVTVPGLGSLRSIVVAQ
ncbi:MAG: fumarylacetoacetate hydrolase family protein [Aeriscardovia sp.]|nr:fumarylacetoacetate hydrolase family protein [Aeriscardovia sp.]